MSNTRHTFIDSPEALEEFVSTWEAGKLPKDKWTHAAHVVICAYYTVQYRGDVFERMRRGIIRHNEAVGTVNSATSGYHETLTRLWVNVISKVVEGISEPFVAASKAVEILGDKNELHRLYYTFDVVQDEKARRTWIIPDRQGPH
jgi:hypothetical protein